MRGKFITIEGTEGVGKSTNLAFIKNHIETAGIELVVTREPGGTPLAEELRQLLLAKRQEPFDPIAELLVVFAARAQHLAQVIEPALAAGKWVLSDRFTDATFAYQGAGRQLSVEVIAILEKLVQKGMQPDKTIWFDIDVEVGLARAKSRADLDRFEQEQIAFFKRVRTGYRDRVKQNPQRYLVVDAGQELAQVQAQLVVELKKLITEFK